MTYSRRHFFASLLTPLAISASACQSQSPAQQQADKFIEAYYVQINIPKALQLTGSLAKDQLEQQLKLVEQGTSDTNPMKPKVEYRLLKTPSEGPEEASYIYNVIVKTEAATPREVFLKLRLENGEWKIVQFREGTQQ